GPVRLVHERPPREAEVPGDEACGPEEEALARDDLGGDVVRGARREVVRRETARHSDVGRTGRAADLLRLAMRVRPRDAPVWREGERDRGQEPVDGEERDDRDQDRPGEARPLMAHGMTLPLAHAPRTSS